MKISSMLIGLALIASAAMFALPSTAHTLDPPAFAVTHQMELPNLSPIADPVLMCSADAVADLCRSSVTVASIEPSLIAPYPDLMTVAAVRAHSLAFAPPTLIPK